MLAGLKIETIFGPFVRDRERKKNQIRITHTHTVHIRGLELVEVMGHPLKFASFLRRVAPIGGHVGCVCVVFHHCAEIFPVVCIQLSRLIYSSTVRAKCTRFCFLSDLRKKGEFLKNPRIPEEDEENQKLILTHSLPPSN